MAQLAHQPARGGRDRARGADGDVARRRGRRVEDQAGDGGGQPLLGPDHSAASPGLDDVLVEIGLEAGLGPRRARVGGEMRRVGVVFVQQRDRPGAALGDRDRPRYRCALIAPGARRSSSSRLPSTMRSTVTSDAPGGMRDGGELAAAADPDIARAIGHDGMEGGEVGRERRQQHDLVRLGRERVLHHPPVRPVRQHVAAEHARAAA